MLRFGTLSRCRWIWIGRLDLAMLDRCRLLDRESGERLAGRIEGIETIIVLTLPPGQ